MENMSEETKEVVETEETSETEDKVVIPIKDGEIDPAFLEQFMQNVFDNQKIDADFIINQAKCPVCQFKKKRGLYLTLEKKGFRSHTSNTDKEAENIGVATICQNCGHFDLYGYDIQTLLYYLCGDAKNATARLKLIHDKNENVT